MFTAVLSQNAQNALALLGKSGYLPNKTYLAGGSSLALQYGHRISVDFDFFTPEKFDENAVAELLQKLSTFRITDKHPNTLSGDFNRVKFSLFQYKYPLVAPAIPFNDINLASPKDIAAMKLAAIMDRGTKKDFIDLYVLWQKGIAVEDAFNYYEKKYKSLSNNLYSLIKSLSYFDDADGLVMPEMIAKISWLEVKKFFKKETIRLAKKYL